MKWLTILLLIALLPACTWGGTKKPPPPEVVPVDTAVAYECGTPPAADPYKALPVRWQVYTLPTGKKAFTLDAQMFENLVTNMVKGLTLSQQLRGQRDFYAECVARSQTPTGPPATGPPADDPPPEK